MRFVLILKNIFSLYGGVIRRQVKTLLFFQKQKMDFFGISRLGQKDGFYKN